MKQFTNTLTAFKSYLVKAGYKNNTIEAYMSDIKAYLKNFKSLNELVRQDFDDHLKYIKMLKASNLSISSKNRKVSSVNALFLCLKDEKPYHGINFGHPDTEFRFISSEEIGLLGLGIKNAYKKPVIARRVKAMLWLAYFCGLKTSELCNLELKDIDCSMEYVEVKERKVPIPIRAASVLNLWLEERKSLPEKEKKKYLFLNQKGYKVSKVYAFITLKSAVEKSSLINKDDVNFANLRNSFARNWANKSIEPSGLATLMGVSNKSQVMKYYL